MKYFYTQTSKLTFLLILLSFLFSSNVYSQALNGTHYVGTGEEFETIQEAVDSLVIHGVDAAVLIIVKAKAGHYYEQIDILPIPGASATFTVTFQSETKTPEDVWILYDATTTSSNNYIVRFNDCDFVTFEYFKMINATLSSSYATVIGFNGTAEYNKIRYNVLIGEGGYQTSDEKAVIQMYREIVNGTEILHNDIQGGSYAVRFDIANLSEITQNVKINYNTCNSYRGISLEDQYKVEIIGNEINSVFGSALYLQFCKNDIKIINNKISSYYTGAHSGIYLDDSDGSVSFTGLVANNVVYVNGDDNLDQNRGIYLKGSNYQNVYHNTVYLRNTNSTGYAFVADGDGTNANVRNNLFAVANYGYAYGTATSTNVSVSDYNNYFTPGNYIAVWNSSLIGELSDLQTANSKDANSTMIYPNIISGDDITGLIPQTHWLDGKGFDLSATIDYDIDSVARPALPDFGAYEFAATNSTTYSGTLTIQASGGTFTSFSEAVDSLMKLGVSGPVTINVEDNTYTERVDLRSIPGVNSSNPLVFQSATGDSTAVIVQYASSGSSGNWTVLLEGTDHVTFKNMTFKNTGASYSRVFRLNGKCHDITITNCILTGNGVAADATVKAIISSSDDDVDNFTITNNIFTNGDRAISFFGASSTDKTTGLLISNNQFSGYHRSIILDDFTDFEISNNLVEDFTYAGIDIQYCNSPYTIKNNRLFSDVTTHAGLRIYRCDGSGDGGLIYNNFIYIEGGCISGIYCYLSGFQSFYNNSINLSSWCTSAKAMDYQYGGVKNNIIIKNNNLFVGGPGYPMYIEGNVVVSESDYNNFYTYGTYVASWNNTNYTDIASLNAATGKDVNSVNYYPGYISDTDLHTNSPWLDSAGVSLAGLVDLDIDGEARDATYPDIGADEYDSPYTPYAGEYTIGLSGRFETFTEAIDSLIERGVNDTVTFKVQTGNYPERITIPYFSGLTSTTPITFESESGNASDVTMVYSSPSATDNAIVAFQNASYITLRNLTLKNNGATYAKVIYLGGNSTFITIDSCILESNGSAQNTQDRTVIHCYGGKPTNLTITNNTITAGSYGIYLRGPSNSDRISGLTISNNEITGGFMGIYLVFHKNFEINNNIINDFTGNGIEILECYTTYDINYNKISSANVSSGSGIYVNYCSGTGDGGLVSNNFIHVEGSTTINGIAIYRGNYTRVFNNSINVVSSNSNSKAFYFNDYSNSGDNLFLKNNNFMVDGPGYPIYTDEGPAITESDFNNLFTSGSYIAYWHATNHANLTALSGASLKDLSSVNYNPVYTSNSDLHSNSYWIDNQGTPLTEITDDMDGESRDGTNPDIGADEFTSTLIPYAGEYSLGASGRFKTFSEAIDSLAERGVLDSVIFKVETGYYTEQFEIPQIANVSVDAAIIFEAATGVATDPVVIYDPSSSNNYVVKLSGADYITFRNISFQSGTDRYARIFNFNGNCDNITLDGNIFAGRSESTNYEDDAIIHTFGGILTNITIKDNIFTNGSQGIFLVNSSSSRGTNLKISDNTFSCYHQGMYINWFTAPLIENNLVTYSHNDGIGINIQNCISAATYGLIIRNNQIYADVYNNGVGALYLLNCDANPAFPGEIYNNVVRTGVNDSYRSRGFDIRNSDNISIYHNTVNITSNDYDDIAFYSETSNNLRIKNNNFVIKGNVEDKTSSHGYAFNMPSGTVAEMDYNNYYTAGRYLARFGGVFCPTLDDLKAETLKDVNSVNYFPGFRGTNNLTVKSSWFDGKAIPIVSVTEDILGTTRDASNPDIGAYEYISTLAPISEGTYSIATFGGDYPGLDSLFKALMERGISGPVTIELMPGSYTNTNFTIKDIPGTNASDTVIIQSQSGDPSNTIISHSQGTTHNYILRFAGTDYITIKDLTFNSGGTTYARIIYFEGNSQNVNIIGSEFNGVASTGVTTNQASIYMAANQTIDNLLIDGNTFSDNSYGICMYGYASYSNNSIKIMNNTFNNQYRNIYIQNIKKPYIYGNEIVAGVQEGIYLNTCDNDLKILNNKIFVSDDSFYAIYLNTCDGTNANKGLIANNFVSVYGVGGSYGSFGIKIDGSNYQRVYHNSVEFTGPKGGAFHVWQGGNVEVANNIFVNSGTQPAYSISYASSISASDFNDIYSTGTSYIHYDGTNYSTLLEYQNATSLDLNSLDVNPVFTSSTDFHLLADSVVGKGAPLTSIVPLDFDGETRDVSNPDIGADEFSCAFFPTPLMEDVTACSNDSIPSLYAEGFNIQWYSDRELTSQVWTANEYDPGHTDAGVYTYYATQTAVGCTSVADSAILTILQAPELSANITQIDCEGTDYGTINLSVGGSTASPFIYQWSNDEIYEDIDKLEAGDYIVSVEDLNGCIEIDTFTVTTPTPIILDIISEDTECDTSFGSATVVATGGEAPYDYRWTPTGDSVTVINDLYAGIYVVNVTDNRGCTETGIATVSDIGAPTITLNSITDVSCYGGKNGAISLTVSGGATPYSYEWSSEETTEDINNKSAGSYQIVVDDNVGCQSIESYIIAEPDPIKISLDITETSCGQSNGAAEAIVTGGTEAYTYLWNPYSTSTGISGLNLGAYNVRVTDGNGCQTTKYFSISEIGAASIIIDSISQGTCGNADGGIYISAYGAYSTFTYNWSSGASTQDLVGVNPGTYNVTVSDAGGCDAVKVATIDADKPDVNPICMVTVDSATYQNEIIWEKEYTDNVASYRVYKQSTDGSYYEIGTVPVGSESIFVDKFSDVMQRPWRYKLAVVDDCGVESDLSEHHKTMHLTINIGVNNSINLIWNHYEGFDYESYYIHRRSNTGWELIDSVPANMDDTYNSYTDANPIFDEELYYMIEIINPLGCNPTKGRNTSRSNITPPTVKTADTEAPTAPTSLATTAITDNTVSLTWGSSTDNVGVTAYEVYKDDALLDEVSITTYQAIGLTAATTYSFYVKAKDDAGNVSAASNTINPTTTGSVGIDNFADNSIKYINIYPNPNKGNLIFNIETTERQEIWYEIYTMNGIKVNNGYLGYVQGKYEKTIDISDQGDGMYFIKIFSKSGVKIEKILLTK